MEESHLLMTEQAQEVKGQKKKRKKEVRGLIMISDALMLPLEAALMIRLPLGRAWRSEKSRSQILREKHQGGTHLYS